MVDILGVKGRETEGKTGRVTEGISSSFILLWPHSEVFYFNLSIVEAERLHFNNHSGDSEV